MSTEHVADLLSEFEPEFAPQAEDMLREAAELNSELAGGHARRGYQIMTGADMGDDPAHALNCILLYSQMDLAEYFSFNYPFASLEEIAQLIRQRIMH